MIETDSSRVQRNKSGELWSTIQKVVHVSLDRRKSTFRETIFPHIGVLAPQIFRRARDSPRLASAHHKPGRPLPKKNFKDEHLKLGLKFQIEAPITLGVVGITSRNSTRGRDSRLG